MRHTSPAAEGASVGEKLISVRGIFLLGAMAIAGLTLLHKNVRNRVQQAANAPPSVVALKYLQLAMDEAPGALAPRLSFVRAAIGAAQFDAARAALSAALEYPLAQASTKAVSEIRVELERRAYIAVPESMPTQREQARSRYVLALEAHSALADGPQDRLHMIRAAQEAGATRLAARLLEARVREDKILDNETLANAAAFPLAQGHPLPAADLYAFAAIELRSTPFANRALDLALSANSPTQSLHLLRRLRAAFPNNELLLKNGLRIADAAGDIELAFEIAETRLALAPNWGPRHDDVAVRAAWLGRTQRQLTEEIWLAEHMTSPAHRDRALRTARAIPDLRAEMRLTAAPLPPFSQASVWKRLNVLEALGLADPALTLAKRATSGSLSGDSQLWDHRIALELATGRVAEAVRSLEHVNRILGPTARRTEQRVQLLFRLGRRTEALDLWADSQLHEDASYAQLSHVASLAFDLSRPHLARRAYEHVVAHRAATEHDYQRLHGLLLADRRHQQARSLAEQGLKRLGSTTLFELALNDARRLHDDTRATALVQLTGTPSHPLHHAPAYVAQRISAMQHDAARALRNGDFDSARQLLHQSRLQLAGHPLADPALDQGSPANARANLKTLFKSQRQQELNLAIATNDLASLAQLLKSMGNELTPINRVTLLRRLGRKEQALEVALRAIDGDADSQALDGRSYAALVREAEHMAASMPRTVALQTGLDDYGPLHSWWARFDVEYAGEHWSANASVRLDALGETGAVASPAGPGQQVRMQVGSTLRRGTDTIGANLGLDVRSNAGPRPYALFESTTFVGDEGSSIQIGGSLNETATDSAELRARGMRDTLSIAANLPVASTVSLRFAAAGLLWSERNRRLVGGGATAEGSANYHFLPRSDLLQFNLQAMARYAPRFRRGPTSALHLPSATWLGTGATLAYGKLLPVPIRKRNFGFQLYGALGWLLPQQQAGFYLEGVISLPVMGGDSFMLRGHTSNAVGSRPGQQVYGASANYSLNLR